MADERRTLRIKALDSDALAGLLVQTIKKALEPLKARNEQLELRVKQLESRPLQRWAGVHVEGTRYEEASLVTRSGSLWAAVKATTTTPGTDGSDWRLVVKKGSYDERGSR